jgi:hypothetical protein
MWPKPFLAKLIRNLYCGKSNPRVLKILPKQNNLKIGENSPNLVIPVGVFVCRYVDCESGVGGGMCMSLKIKSEPEKVLRGSKCG